jgi:hypothetical protein
MHTRIGAPSADNFNGLIRHPAKGVLHNTLDGYSAGLSLPATVGVAVVFDSAGEAAQIAA